MQQLVDDGSLRLADCMPQPPDPVAAEWLGGVAWMHYAMRDVKDMGQQQMGYCSLEWNWPKEAMNIPIWAGFVDGAKLFKPFS